MQIYLGTFLLAFAMLALEITLTRLLSVTTWYHLAFFAIATAMLGMTAGATVVYLNPKRFCKEKLHEQLAKACVRFGLVVPVSLVVLCLVPLDFWDNAMALCATLLVTAACSAPFYFAGIAVTLILTKYPLPIGRLYASDLVGAAFGCLFVLGGLGHLDAPSLILLCGSIGALAGSVFARRGSLLPLARRCFVVFALTAIAGLGNATSPRLIRPVTSKGKICPAHHSYLEKWNSFSRVTVEPLTEGSPPFWGRSPAAPKVTVLHHPMKIDGEAGTDVNRFRSPEDIEHLRFAVTNVAYHIRPRGGACIIGVGGGRDMQSAVLFGHEHVKGIEINPIFVKLLKKDFREFAGLADHKGVTFVVDEARSYLSHSKEKFSIVQMALTDTWAATGAGAFSLSENTLYTVEAWDIFLDRLANDGVFTVSRWYSPNNLGETGRLVSLAVAALLRSGVADPSEHLALVTCRNISTLVLGKLPLCVEDVETLKKVCQQFQYSPAILPGQPPQHTTLRELISARSLEELELVARDQPLRCEPPTDEDPYFFNMLRVGHLLTMWTEDRGVIHGNLKATLTLTVLALSLLVLTTATILVPLVFRSKGGEVELAPVLWSGAAYFSLIGCGFMLTEIALIQKLSVLLSHPVYALGILLFAMILSSGMGSLVSERLPLSRTPWIFIYPIVAVAAILVIRMLVDILLRDLMTSPMATKTVASIAVIFPLGVVMGLFFPTGMRLVRTIRAEATPWYWALNGIFGVLASALAVFLSINFGISTNFYVAAGCYALVLPCVWSFHRQRPLDRLHNPGLD